MPKKTTQYQHPIAKQPRQERSRYKVQLILEATVQLLEKGGMDALTTNAVAASAGVSIGTLYQFFPNKEAILDSLADREIADMSDAVLKVMEDPTNMSPQERVGAVVHVVTASYGGRHAAHRVVMAHSLNRRTNRLAPLLSNLIAHLSGDREFGAKRQAIPRSDAFVLAHAFAGVLRAMTIAGEDAPSADEIADALSRLVVRFIG